MERSDWHGHVTVPKGGRSRQVGMTQRLTAALKTARHLRGDRVLCLPDGSPITRDRVIKAVRSAQRVARIDQVVHIPRHTFCSHLSMKGGACTDHPGAGRTRGPVDDAALHAPQPGGQQRTRSGCSTDDNLASNRRSNLETAGTRGRDTVKG